MVGAFSAAPHLDVSLALADPNDGGARLAQGLTGQVPHRHRRSAHLDRLESRVERDANRSAGGRRRGQAAETPQDQGADQRRPNNASRSVRTMEMRMEVPSGK